jgi:Na+/proline symporter
VGTAANKSQFLDTTVSLSRGYTLWAGIIGGAFLTTATHGTDQLMVQRYLCSRGPRQAAGALLVSGAVIYAQFGLFLLIGVMLFVFYGSSGGAVLPVDVAARADRVFPHFIVTQLPAGVVGLVIAAIFAAAMSTLSSSLNSSAATAMADFYRPLYGNGRSEAHYLRVSRRLTAFWGVVQILVAFGAVQASQRIVDSVLSIASFTSGPVLGLFLLGTLTKETTQRGALAGVVAGVLFMLFVWLQLDVSWQWYVLLGAGVTFGVGSTFRR